ncbi:MAG: YhjD/YihY/BrkB family envelope integrity protein [Verrucomicrobiales bacterium]|nr:YhjD/YihY/BrkB family envelope integrity protein [Verrucomicrobiales bacterium]
MRALKFLVRAIRRWMNRDGPGQAAAVSFYAVFGMAPLLVFAVVVASKALGPERAKVSAVNWLADMIPQDAAETLVSIVHVKLLADGPWWSNLLSGGVLIWAASLIFMRLVVGTRAMFGEAIESASRRFRQNLIGRGIALSFAICVGLLVCLVFVVSSLATPIVREWPVGTKTLLGMGNAFILMIGGVVLLCVVTPFRLRKRALTSAAAFLFIAFMLGRVLFQSYITHSVISSAYGVASSVVVFLVWIYYMACGYFIGAAICAEFRCGQKKDQLIAAADSVADVAHSNDY